MFSCRKRLKRNLSGPLSASSVFTCVELNQSFRRFLYDREVVMDLYDRVECLYHIGVENTGVINSTLKQYADERYLEVYSKLIKDIIKLDVLGEKRKLMHLLITRIRRNLDIIIINEFMTKK
jgi:hypothetical protein